MVATRECVRSGSETEHSMWIFFLLYGSIADLAAYSLRSSHVVSGVSSISLVVGHFSQLICHYLYQPWNVICLKRKLLFRTWTTWQRRRLCAFRISCQTTHSHSHVHTHTDDDNETRYIKSFARLLPVLKIFFGFGRRDELRHGPAMCDEVVRVPHKGQLNVFVWRVSMKKHFELVIRYYEIYSRWADIVKFPSKRIAIPNWGILLELERIGDFHFSTIFICSRHSEWE